MKCLLISGEDELRDLFARNFSRSLKNRTVCFISENSRGGLEVSFPGASSTLDLIASMPPDIVLASTSMEIAAPVVHCGEGDAVNASLVLSRYDGNDSSACFQDIYNRTFHLLPQKTADQCGRCGMDCFGLAEAIIRGEKSESDCYFATSGVEVKQGGRLLELSKFPSSIIEGAIRGLVSSLKGYDPGEDITIELRNCDPESVE